jgi:hypothetical protein
MPPFFTAPSFSDQHAHDFTGSAQAEMAMVRWDELLQKEKEANESPPDSEQFCLPLSLKEELTEAAAEVSITHYC